MSKNNFGYPTLEKLWDTLTTQYSFAKCASQVRILQTPEAQTKQTNVIAPNVISSLHSSTTWQDMCQTCME